MDVTGAGSGGSASPPDRSWWAIALDIEPDGFPAVAARLKRLGLFGCIAEATEGGRVEVRAFLPVGSLPRSRLAALPYALAADARRLGLAAPGVRVERVARPEHDLDWPPVEIGDRLRVQRAGLPVPDDGRHTLEILPLPAFGLALHPSTRTCLELLQELPLDCAVVADVGCGTGVLGLGALALGARRVVAVDLDPVAVAAAEANRDHAGWGPEAMDVRRGGVERLEGPLDGVCCNAPAGVVVEVVGRLGALGARWAIVSRTAGEDAGAVEAATTGVGWRVAERRDAEGWCTALVRPGDAGYRPG